MSVLGMSQAEYDYYVDQIRESMLLIGQEALLYQVDREVKDLYRDPNLTYLDPVKIALVFDDNPRPILKKFNWMTEDEELPYVAHIVALSSNREKVIIRENMVIRIKSKYGLQADRYFLVSKVTGNHIDPLTWICKLVPYREKVDLQPDSCTYQDRVEEGKETTSFGFLNTK